MKKIVFMVGIIGVAIAGVIIFKRTNKPATTSAYTIGILQTASHPALDAARDGFMEELKTLTHNDVTFVIQNAQGSVAQAHAMAQQFHANNQLHGFFAIATPAAQALGVVEKERPIIIAAVTDPDALGLIHPTTNICGTKDMIDVKAEVEMLTQLVPNAKTVAILYTAGETNSIVLANMMRKELAAHGLIALDFAVGNEADMPAVVEAACRKSDVILAPTDNTVASTVSLIATIANKHKKPLIVSDNMLVKYGPLAARGVDYNKGGKQAARIACDILMSGKKPHEIPIQQAQSKQIFVNPTTLDRLGLTIPEALQKDVVLITQD